MVSGKWDLGLIHLVLLACATFVALEDNVPLNVGNT